MTTAKATASQALKRLKQAVDSTVIKDELQRSEGGRLRLERAKQVIEQAEVDIAQPPNVSVAMLGPSRNGKSTLLNALMSNDILPTSDIRPCTASIIRLAWSQSWNVELGFVSMEELRADMREAMKDAQDYINQSSSSRGLETKPDDPRYFRQLLSRFTTLFKIPEDLPPREVFESLRNGKLDSDTAKLLGKKHHAKGQDLSKLRKLLETYLSTQDIYWTIVNSCTISGPFPDWHESLELMDIPGTNDTNVERTRITNSLQDKCRAVAVVTSESNLGIDIQSWLQNSTVLSRFLESRDADYQRIAIIRTKFDSYNPQLEPDVLGSNPTEEDEIRETLRLVDTHIERQTVSFHEMLKEIALPLLPPGETREERQVHNSRIGRIESIPVWFVSAVTYDAFTGRVPLTARQKAHMKFLFGDDINRTGIPQLREYLNQLAKSTVDGKFYHEIIENCEEELDRLVEYFRSQRVLVVADSKGSGTAISKVVENTKNEIVPWFSHVVREKSNVFRQNASQNSNHLKRRMQEIAKTSDRRLHDKVDKWSHLAWNTLRATARKGGIHTTSSGNHLDINNDICSVLIDELIIGWAAYRDEVIETQLSDITNAIAVELRERLARLAEVATTNEAREAVGHVMNQLLMLTNDQRHEMLRRVENLLSRLQSIRAPAMEIIFAQMEAIYASVGQERGPGCQRRMQEKLVVGFQRALPHIRQQIFSMIEKSVAELLNGCGDALERYGDAASRQIQASLTDVKQALQDDQRQLAQARIERLDNALILLSSSA